jgi:DNA-binding transcriptional LysR family regulator
VLEIVDAVRLRAFREVALKGSFTAAAASLRISQPAVSQHIAKLERDTGVVLLDRSTRRVRLTGPGQVLLKHAESVLGHLEQARVELAGLRERETGVLRLAAFPSAAATIVPPLIGAFRENLPGVAVQLSEADPPISLPRLAAGELDAVIAYDYPLLAITRQPAQRWHVIAEDPMAVAVCADDPLADRPEIRLPDLADRPWVAPYDCVCRDALMFAARRAQFTPSVVSETNDYLAMLGIVAAGVGVAVLPRLIARHAGQAVALRPLADPQLRRTIAVVTRANGYSPRFVDRLIDLSTQVVPTVAHPDLPLLMQD